MVPNGWNFNKLEELATVERGKFSARPRNDPKYYGGSIPFVQTGDIASSKTYLTDYSQTLNEKGLKVSRLFPKNTILITIAANIGDTAITSFDVACPDSLVAIQPNVEKADTYWLKKVLETRKADLDGKATQNAQKNINLQVLKPLSILTPPISEQRKIAKILSTWDKAISTTERLIDNSKQQKKALMQQLLTGKKRLLDESGKPFEGEWEEVKLGDLSSKVTKGTTPSTNGFSFQQDGINFVKVESISSSGRFDRSKFAYIDNDCYESFKRSQLEKDDILFSIAGALGRTALVDETILPANTNQALAIVRLNRTRTVHRYIIYYLNSPRIASVIKGRTAKAAQPNLSLKDVNGLTILLPSLEEQEKISTALFNADKEIELLEQQLSDLKQEKKALMQQLLTGKRRVKVDDEAVA